VKIIGLTGGIATGKSTVSKMLVERGYEVIDADVVARELQVKGSPLLSELVSVFGSTILAEDGNLIRGKLGSIIFTDDKARSKVDDIFRPAIRAEFERRIAQSQQEILFLDVPLLFEAGFDELTTENLVISLSYQKQLERLMNRNDLTKFEAEARINAQMPMVEKVVRADYVIDNDGNLQDLLKQVEKFLGGMTHERNAHGKSTIIKD